MLCLCSLANELLLRTFSLTYTLSCWIRPSETFAARAPLQWLIGGVVCGFFTITSHIPGAYLILLGQLLSGTTRTPSNPTSLTTENGCAMVTPDQTKARTAHVLCLQVGIGETKLFVSKRDGKGAKVKCNIGNNTVNTRAYY